MGERVLVIEDDRSIAELIRDYLEINGMQAELAADGAQGLEIALSTEPDLIVLDLMLPGLDGFEVCRQLRARSQKPILILSARWEDIDKIRGLGLGADDYVEKPFSPGELMARIKAHIARYRRLTGGSAAELKDLVRMRDLEVATESRMVRVRGVEALLAGKEFDILLLLLRSPGKVFSKEEIFSRVWGEDRYGDLSTVTVHVRRIREKIEVNPSEPEYIETVWGVGYRLK
ncbi:MAG: response regulator transcription factor [Rectinemataceae bacterium]